VAPSVSATPAAPGGFNEDAKIALGTGIGVPVGLFLLSLIPGYLTYKIRRRPQGQSINQMLSEELTRWRRRLWPADALDE